MLDPSDWYIRNARPRAGLGLLTMAFCLVFCVTPGRADLTINISNGGGAAPASFGGTGTIDYVMDHAAQVWELAYNDDSFSHSLDIEYRWEALSGGTLGEHRLLTQGGTPNRETGALIRFDNDGSSNYFIDGTLNGMNPLVMGNEEYSGLTTVDRDFGGVNNAINSQRRFNGGQGDAAGRFDLFSIALHEIGHALGLSSGNLSYRTESWSDNDIDVGALFPLYMGAVIPTNNGNTPETGSTSNAHLSSSDSRTNLALMYPFASSGRRTLPSELDILANAQISQFANPNFGLISAIPEPTGRAVTGLLTAGLFGRRRRR